jgi:hypothetical protein
MYNEHVLTTASGNGDFITPMALSAIPEDKRPDKTTFYAAAIKSIQNKGHEELGKVIGFMYSELE